MTAPHSPQSPQVLHLPTDPLLTMLGIDTPLVWPQRDALRQAWVEAAARASTITSERAVGAAFTALACEWHACTRYQQAVELHEQDTALQGRALDALAGAVSVLSEAVALWGRVIVLLDHLHRVQHPSSAPTYEPAMTHVQRLTTTLWMLQRILRLYCSTLHLLPPLCTIGTLDTSPADAANGHDAREPFDRPDQHSTEGHP